MASFQTLYPRLQTEAVGAPPALMDLKIRDAARMFMKEAPAYQARQADITIIPETAVYALTPPGDAEVVRVLRMNFLATDATRARAVLPVAEGMLRADWEVREGGIRHFTTPTINFVTLVPIPDVNVAGELQNIHLQLRPTRDATTINDAVLDRWEEEIMTGALWLMYDMQDQPWTNKAEARRMKLRFTKMWGNARRDLIKGFTQSDLHVKIRPL